MFLSYRYHQLLALVVSFLQPWACFYCKEGAESGTFVSLWSTFLSRCSAVVQIGGRIKEALVSLRTFPSSSPQSQRNKTCLSSCAFPEAPSRLLSAMFTGSCLPLESVCQLFLSCHLTLPTGWLRAKLYDFIGMSGKEEDFLGWVVWLSPWGPGTGPSISTHRLASQGLCKDE